MGSVQTKLFAVSEYFFPSSEEEFLHQLDEMLAVIKANSDRRREDAGNSLLELQQVVDSHIYDELEEISVHLCSNGGPDVE